MNKVKRKQGKPITATQGRQLALQTMDCMLAEAKNIRALRQSLQELFNASPAMFFKEFVMPLLPKQAVLDFSTEKSPLQIVLTESPKEITQ